jgi:tetratricopeptide (TPR) repeat protein
VFFLKKNLLFCWFLFCFVLFCFVFFPFLNSPLFFDDQYFFNEGFPEKFLSDGFKLYPRWWVYESLALTYVEFSHKVFWLRLENALLHFSVAWALAVFIRDLLLSMDKRSSLLVSPEMAVALASALFLMHPLAALTHGYLIQRTILCATLFSLLSLIAFWRGMAGGKLWMFWSCVFFALAVYAKEHVVMLPFVAVLLAVLRLRSGSHNGFFWRQMLLPLLVQGVIAILVVLQLKSLIGTPYEMNIGEVLEGQVDVDQALLYPLSFLNQIGLFFRYLGLWILPLPALVSVDIRVPFNAELFSSSNVLAILLFFSYLLIGGLLLLRGRALGLVGFSMLAPAVLYCTELSTVRFQEPFVLYRSYLWAAFLFIPVALLFRSVNRRLAIILGVVFLVFFTAMSFLRLKTYSHPVFVWQEAADVFERVEGAAVLGGYRIYYNLGTELMGLGFIDSSISAFTRAIELKPNYGWSWNNRGSAYLSKGDYSAAKTDFEMAVKFLPGDAKPWRGVVAVLAGTNNREGLVRAQNILCILDGGSDCEAMDAQSE